MYDYRQALYEDIAREVLTGPAVENGVFFNTNVEVGKLGMPLGELNI